MKNKLIIWICMFILLVGIVSAQDLNTVDDKLKEELRKTIKQLYSEFDISEGRARTLWKDANLDESNPSFDEYVLGGEPDPDKDEEKGEGDEGGEGGGDEGGIFTTRNSLLALILIGIPAYFVIRGFQRRRAVRPNLRDEDRLDRISEVNREGEELAHFRDYVARVRDEKQKVIDKIGKLDSNLRGRVADLIKRLKKEIRDVAFLYGEREEEFENISEADSDVEAILKIDRNLIQDLEVLEEIENRILQHLSPTDPNFNNHVTNYPQLAQPVDQLRNNADVIQTKITTIRTKHAALVQSGRNLADLLNRKNRRLLADKFGRGKTLRNDLIDKSTEKFRDAVPEYEDLQHYIEIQINLLDTLLRNMNNILGEIDTIGGAEFQVSTVSAKDGRPPNNEIPIDTDNGVYSLGIRQQRPFSIELEVTSNINFNYRIDSDVGHVDQRDQNKITINVSNGVIAGEHDILVHLTPEIQDIQPAELQQHVQTIAIKVRGTGRIVTR